MIVDTSVLVAILLDEPEFNEFTLLIQESVECRMSAVSFVELLIVMESGLVHRRLLVSMHSYSAPALAWSLLPMNRRFSRVRRFSNTAKGAILQA